MSAKQFKGFLMFSVGMVFVALIGGVITGLIFFH